jgi:glutaredoxin 3
MSDGGKGSSPRPFSVTQEEFANSFELIFGKRKRNMKAVVWSKNQCPYCVQAKSLLEMKGIEYEERNVQEDWTKEQLLEAVPTARTLPQIFLDDNYIGGFTELKKHFEKV